MALVTAETDSEGVMDHALLPTISVSSVSHTSAQNLLDVYFPSSMDTSRTSSRSSSRSRAYTTSATEHNHALHIRFSSVDGLYREPSTNHYSLFPSYEELEMTSRPTREPRVLEPHLAPYTSPECLGPQHQETEMSSPESSQQLTPSSSSSKVGENIDATTEPSYNPASQVLLEEVSLVPETTTDQIVPMLDIDSGSQVIDCEEYTPVGKEILEEDLEMSESEDESFGEYWTPSNEDFEQRVLQATDFNFELAAQLIPVLYKTFQGEKSTVLGHWETSHRTRAGNPHDQTAEACEGIDLPSADQGRTPLSRKKRKANEDKDEYTQDDDGQDNADDPSDGPDENTAHGALLLACPFYKKDPSKYNGSSHRTSTARKGEYAKCDSGFLKFKDMREHLVRVHRHVQCGYCPKMFIGSQGAREEAIMNHRELEECSKQPPRDNEGITDRQWFEIRKLPKNARSPSLTGKFDLDSQKWNQIWAILFPGHQLPATPWYIRHPTESRPTSSLHEETEEFRKCFDQLNTGNFPSPKDHAVRAFEMWFSKRRMEQGMAQLTMQDSASLAGASPAAEQVQPYHSLSFAMDTATQGRRCVPRHTSSPFVLQTLPAKADAPGTQPSGQGSQRRATISHTGIQPPDHMTRSQQPVNWNLQPNYHVSYPQGHINQSMHIPGGSQQLDTSQTTLDFLATIHDPATHQGPFPYLNTRSPPHSVSTAFGTDIFNYPQNTASTQPHAQLPGTWTNQPYASQAYAQPSGSNINQTYANVLSQPEQVNLQWQYTQPQHSGVPDMSGPSQAPHDENVYDA